jgi:hypothetical protein
LTFATILAELVARGAEDNSARNGVWVNNAYKEIVNAYDWPFTYTAVTGDSGAGTADTPYLRKAILVGDISDDELVTPGRPLSKITLAELSDVYEVEDANPTGRPEFWYLEASSPGDEQIVAYPPSGTLFVRYHRFAATLTGSDVPMFRDDYHYLIVDRAMVEVKKDNNEYDAAEQVLRFYERGLARMAKELQVYSREGSYVQVPNPTDG